MLLALRNLVGGPSLVGTNRGGTRNADFVGVSPWSPPKILDDEPYGRKMYALPPSGIHDRAGTHTTVNWMTPGQILPDSKSREHRAIEVITESIYLTSYSFLKKTFITCTTTTKMLSSLQHLRLLHPFPLPTPPHRYSGGVVEPFAAGPQRSSLSSCLEC
jgi:hypothetical protein